MGIVYDHADILSATNFLLEDRKDSRSAFSESDSDSILFGMSVEHDSVVIGEESSLSSVDVDWLLSVGAQLDHGSELSGFGS